MKATTLTKLDDYRLKTKDFLYYETLNKLMISFLSFFWKYFSDSSQLLQRWVFSKLFVGRSDTEDVHHMFAMKSIKFDWNALTK